MKVAVYGSLRQGFGNHQLLQDSEFLGTMITQNEWTMYSLGGFPGIVPKGEISILTEVYEVNDEIFQRLDRLEGYPEFYNRQEIETPYGQAWIYYLEDRPSWGSPIIVQSGDWAEYKSQVSRRYG